MQTRTYPRNSVLAFPRTVEYAAAVERPYDPEDRLVMVACLVAAVFLIGVLAIWG
ncbi:hypothetical protein ACT80S_18375 [Ramlibacter sp. MAHUQ-53]|uniref:hypothetical protein n=1 Tax=unclassified Ramlibacter TaxID=2617605 RepID=UPI0036286243